MCKSVQARILDLEMSEDRAPQIRGVVRAELVADLAIGELSHDQLAEKYERSRFAIDQFSSRNRDEIRLAKQDMSPLEDPVAAPAQVFETEPIPKPEPEPVRGMAPVPTAVGPTTTHLADIDGPSWGPS